ncbi:MAG: hypothetical protein Q8868_01640 [Bacteroidota bacterium]|nr:hypothetical protein [Bacteroidota bacterium]
MLNIFRIVVLVLSVLIAYINTGILRMQRPKSDNILSDNTLPHSSQFVNVDYFLLINNYSGSRIKISPVNFDKYLQKINFLQNLLREVLINRYFGFSFKTLRQEAIILPIFSPPDIIFPFNYFW